MKIFLDPGHGGDDPGSLGPTGYNEEDFVLEWAILMDLALRRAGHQVMWSHYGDEATKVPNIHRVRAANNWGADVYISLHANGFDKVQDPDNVGMEVLYWYTSNESRTLADRIREEIVSRFEGTIVDRGSKAIQEGGRGQTVLRRTAMPAVIIEPGFITDEDDEKWLRYFSTQALLAEAVEAAISSTFTT